MAQQEQAADGPQLSNLNLEEESVEVQWAGKTPFQLEGCYFQDLVGHNHSKPFGPLELQPGKPVRFWTSPGRKVQEDASNLVWRNQNGRPRVKPVLNNDGDGLRLLSADGEELARIASSGTCEQSGDEVTGTEAVDSKDQKENEDEEEEEEDVVDDDAAQQGSESADDLDDKDDDDEEEEADDRDDAEVEEDIDALVDAAFASKPLFKVKESANKARLSRVELVDASAGQADAELMRKAVISARTEQAAEAPLQLSRHKKEAIRRNERKKNPTAGRKWFNMPATEITPEVAADLKILGMRDVLDRKRHYRSADSSQPPKFFQVGRIVDGAADFYSDRSTKKAAKRTLVDELLEDQSTRRYNKQKFVQLSQSKFAANKHKGSGSFKGRGKGKGKPTTGPAAKKAKKQLKRPF
ncbi:uncharacterized protein MONBRDRAFT_26080 [Monosiga brevicollis MX1]|uniref:Fcf2 pre-rRNA processing C-terminal domain-containing protein n=1 Tax=Monosiga brevicollis TaxID=81824 RepID=A9V1B3_MONBE|nr:uncharacterized protein MONBRDRAFT_26080 [Monosiga brevicollis MX1]EDQ88777.1 predicted protein [Monosiga brevicollis MX1]|eukprot:XP_001746390.1 hypothetical protein [Monosiga brevicollis MX1]